jgi:hypothetical protein
MKNNRVSVIVAHERDSAWKDVSARMSTVLAEGLIQSFCVLVVQPEATLGIDPPIQVLSISREGQLSNQSTTLLGYLSSLGQVAEVAIAGVRCDSAAVQFNENESHDLNNALRELRQLLIKFATNLRQRNYRIAIIGEGEKAPGSPFFTPLADANVVAMPRDISMTQAVAKPILRENSQSFVAHAAMELSSILGLWATMNSSPLDGISHAPLGVSGYRLHLFSSRVKGLVTPPLPIADLVDDSSELPLPSGYSAVDNLTTLMDRYASAIFPANMVFDSLKEPDPYIRRSWREIGVDYISEFARTLGSIPSMLKHGFKGEIDAIGANALDRLLGGADARIRPIVPSDDDDVSPFVSTNAIEETIRSLEFREDRPIAGAVEPDQWETLVTQVLGIADAHPQVSEVRQTVMPDSLLVKDKTHIAPRSSDIGSLVETILPPAPKVENVAVLTADSEDQVPSSGGESQGSSQGDESSNFEDSPALAEPIVFMAPGDIDLEALRDAVRRSGIERPYIENQNSNDGVVDLEMGDTAIQIDRDVTSLISRLTMRFDQEFNKSEESVIRSLSELRSLPGRFTSTEIGGVSRSVFVTIAVALAAIVVSLATHDPLRGFFSFDWMSRRNRDFVWVAFSSVVLVVGIATMPTGRWKNWQSRIMITSAICAGLLGFEFVVFDFVRNEVIEIPWAATTALIAILILLGTGGVLLLSIWRNSVSEDPIRKRLSRLMCVVLWVYLVFGLSSFIAGPESFIIDWEDGTRRNLLIAAQFVGWLCLLMGTLVIVAVRVRQRNAFSLYDGKFKWAQGNLTHSIDARRHLRVAYLQWLSTAAILSRIVWYPLGREASDRVPFEGELTSDESILKFDLAKIELSERGHIALLAQLRQMFVREGWLKKQFEFAREAYKIELAEITHDPSDQHDPLSCVSTPSIESLRQGDARGDRVAFAQKLFDGSFDETLLSSATWNNLDTVYANILGDELMHHVEHAQNTFDSGIQFLSDIIPNDASTLPPFLLRSLLVPSDESLKLKNQLWWPQTSLLSLPPTNHAEVHSSEVLALEKLNDSVVMLAVLVGLSEAFVNSDVTCVEDIATPSAE